MIQLLDRSVKLHHLKRGGWRWTQVLTNGAISSTPTVTKYGGFGETYWVFFFSASASSNLAGGSQLVMNCLLDGSFQAELLGFSNEVTSHKAFPMQCFEPSNAKQQAGSYTFSIQGSGNLSNTVVDGNDFMCLTTLEMPV